MRGTFVVAAALFFGAVASAQVAQLAQVERLDSGHQPLVRDFLAGKGRARLIAILSPT